MTLLNRRTFLSAGATGAAALTLIPRLAQAQITSTASAAPFAVRAREGRAGSPWLIRGTTPIMAKVSGTDVGGRYAVIEVNTPPGRGPELHVHPAQNEIFFILRGRVGLVCGDQRTVLETGDTFFAPAGIPHAYVGLGTEVAGILNTFDPAGSMEQFFAAYTQILNAGGPPDRKRMEDAYAANGMKVVGRPLSASSFT